MQVKRTISLSIRAFFFVVLDVSSLCLPYYIIFKKVNRKAPLQAIVVRILRKELGFYLAFSRSGPQALAAAKSDTEDTGPAWRPFWPCTTADARLCSQSHQETAAWWETGVQRLSHGTEFTSTCFVPCCYC